MSGVVVQGSSPPPPLPISWLQAKYPPYYLSLGLSLCQDRCSLCLTELANFVCMGLLDIDDVASTGGRGEREGEVCVIYKNKMENRKNYPVIPPNLSVQ